MTWTEFRNAMLQAFLRLGLQTANVFELGSIKKKVYARRMVLASAYIRMIREYDPNEMAGTTRVHVLTEAQMNNVMRNLNGLFETNFFYNFSNDY